MKKLALALGEVSNGKLITTELEIADLTGFIVGDQCNLFVKKGDKQKITVTISGNILKDLDLNVIHGIWTIGFKKNLITTRNFHEFTMVIESPYIQAISKKNIQ